MEIVVNDQSVTLKFSFSFYRRLGEKWGLKTLQEVLQRVVDANKGVVAGDVAFESIATYADIVQAASNTSIDYNDLQDYLFERPELIGQIVEAFVDSMILPSDQGGEDAAVEKKS